MAHFEIDLILPDAPQPSMLGGLIPSELDLLVPVFALGLQAVLWYLPAHYVLQQRLKTRTTTPFRRIFTNLIYLAAGPLMFWELIRTAYTFGLVRGFGAVLLLSAGWINNLPDFPGYAILGVLLLLFFIALLLPLLLIICSYTVALCRAMFYISKKRAITLSLVIWFVNVLVVTIPTTLFTAVALPSSLSSQEYAVVRNLKAIDKAEEMSKLWFGKEFMQLDDLIQLLSTGKAVEFAAAVPELAIVRDLHQENGVWQYSMTLSGDHFFIEAIPLKHDAEHKHCFLAMGPSSMVWVSTGSATRATVWDKLLIFMP
jgi:hypothetical protein